MSHGNLSHAQQTALKPYIEGKIVHDLGCGDLELTHQLIGFGATEVVAIDRHTPTRQILKGAPT